MDEMVANDSIDGPANLKQIRNKKYRMTKQSNTGSGSNVADQVLTTIGMLTSHETVQKIIHCKNKITCIILYSNHQIEDLKSNCIGDNGLSCWVPPTFTGMVTLIHINYHAFVAHLNGELQSHNITLGSDDEKGLTKALRLGFPMATHLLCTLHLKDNIRAYMSDKVGCSVKERTQILRLIFGSDGLCSSDDTATLKSGWMDCKGILNDTPDLHSTLRNTWQKNCVDYVIEPMKQGVVTELWVTTMPSP